MEYNLKVFELQGFIFIKKKHKLSKCYLFLFGFDRRGRIQRAAVQMWPGNDFPNFRLAEEKAKLDQLAASLEEECSIPEISFGFEGIKKHIQSVFNERRRSRKRERIDYDLVGSYIKYTILLKAILCHTCLHAVRIRTL